MFKTERNKRLFHIFSDLFIAFFWSWTLYIQYHIEYHHPFEITFQRFYMIVLSLFIVATLGRIIYHYAKLRNYTKHKKEATIKPA